MEAKMRGLLRGQYAALSISFNDHTMNYVDALGAEMHGMFDPDDWVSEEEKSLALSTNSVWRLQWYPDTPVGCYVVLASGLVACLDAAVAIARADGLDV